MKVHFHTDDGQDHVVKSVSLSGFFVGQLEVAFTCCTSLLQVTPEEFAMSYSIRHSDSPVPTKE